MATRVAGKVSHVWVDETHAVVKLSGLPTDTTPLNGLFDISKSDRNFNALYSLALSAAINRYILNIETTTDIASRKIAIVKELWVEW